MNSPLRMRIEADENGWRAGANSSGLELYDDLNLVKSFSGSWLGALARSIPALPSAGMIRTVPSMIGA